jgi:uncharacterized protein YutE (UPF0331/DUF86 family)
MTDKEKLQKYISNLEIYISQLAELQGVNKQEFLNNWQVYGLVDRWLHLALETFLSLGEMIISEFNFRKPDTYADIPKILGENNVIPKELVEKLIDLAKFRNVLVHEYLYLDHERVYEHLQKDPVFLLKFLKSVKKFIKEKG